MLCYVMYVYLSICLSVCLSVCPSSNLFVIIIYLLSVYPSTLFSIFKVWNLLLLINMHQFTEYVKAAIASGW